MGSDIARRAVRLELAAIYKREAPFNRLREPTVEFVKKLF